MDGSEMLAPANRARQIWQKSSSSSFSPHQAILATFITYSSINKICSTSFYAKRHSILYHLEIPSGIEMEADYPGKNEDTRLPILDMQCWLNESGFAVYTHYGKPIATKQVISARSAHPDQCKRSVH